MRRGFSVIELTVCLMLVTLFSFMAMTYYADEPEKALVARASHELKTLQKEVQGRALKAHNYHFATLEQALGRSEPLLDPWGHPYILMHGTFDYQYRPEVDFWVNGKADALYSSSTQNESGEQMLDHWIISAGPNKAFLQGQDVGPDGAKLDDLKVKVRLGKPQRAGATPGQRNPPRQVSVDSTSIDITLWDHASDDGDLIEVRVNGSMQVPKFRITHTKKTYPLALISGANVIEVFAHNEGTGSPNTCSAELTHVTAGEALSRWGLLTSESGTIHVLVP